MSGSLPNLQPKGKVYGFTIDPYGSKDLDDAMTYQTIDSQSGIIRYIIPAPALHIPLGSKEFGNVYWNVETDYASDPTRPMLDRNFSENSLSLLSNGEKRCIIVSHYIVKVQKRWVTRQYSVDVGVFESVKQLTYDDADKILHNDPTSIQDLHLSDRSKIISELRMIGEITLSFKNKFHKKRISSSIDYDTNTFTSHRIVCELSLLTNMRLAQFCAQSGYNFLIRNHPISHWEINETTGKYHAVVVYKRKGFLKKGSINETSAKYSVDILGHYGLNLQLYAHFTSPLRRLADFLNNYIIVSILYGQKNPFSRKFLEDTAYRINFHSALIKSDETIIKAMMRTESVIETVFEKIPTKDFSDMISRGVMGDQLDAMKQEIERRIESNQLKSIDYFRILFSDTWNDLHDLCLSAIHDTQKSNHLLTYLQKGEESPKALQLLAKRTNTKSIQHLFQVYHARIK